MLRTSTVNPAYHLVSILTVSSHYTCQCQITRSFRRFSTTVLCASHICRIAHVSSSLPSLPFQPSFSSSNYTIFLRNKIFESAHQVFPASCSFLALRFRYSSLHTLTKLPQYVKPSLRHSAMRRRIVW